MLDFRGARRSPLATRCVVMVVVMVMALVLVTATASWRPDRVPVPLDGRLRAASSSTTTRGLARAVLSSFRGHH